MGMEDNKLSLARIYYPVKVLGPGLRVGIWLNGCPRQCRGCISPELQKYDISKEVTVKQIVNMIRKISGPIDGITISGGEPFLKREALGVLITNLLEISDDILIYSGYTLDELKQLQDYDVDYVLENCACIVDGPYIEELNDSKGLRGSSNQKIWINRYFDRYSDFDKEERRLQNVVYNDSVLTIGIPRGIIND